ncbi:uncharacterized protein LOC135923186 isoform X3 [Gordionus sp. m RMFG-2023]|uniref:uncharacterized protein LOC135923186 isoform X3 n=1 Tax=Gordionus sp. m RMFG-2023 TaxID=3053472 RepID=UPI0031FD5029
MIIAMTLQFKNKGIVFSTYSGSINSIEFQCLENIDDIKKQMVKLICETSYKPYIILWTLNNTFLVSGACMSVDVYTPPTTLYQDDKGIKLSDKEKSCTKFELSQNFDFSSENDNSSSKNLADENVTQIEIEINCACLNADGHIAAFGSFNNIRFLIHNENKSLWEFSHKIYHTNANFINNQPYFYCINSIIWNSDPSQIIIGTGLGGLYALQCFTTKIWYRDKNLEFTFVTDSCLVVHKKGITSQDSSFLNAAIDKSFIGNNQYSFTITSPSYQAIDPALTYFGSPRNNRNALLVCKKCTKIILTDMVDKIYCEIDVHKSFLLIKKFDQLILPKTIVDKNNKEFIPTKNGCIIFLNNDSIIKDHIMISTQSSIKKITHSAYGGNHENYHFLLLFKTSKDGKILQCQIIYYGLPHSTSPSINKFYKDQNISENIEKSYNFDKNTYYMGTFDFLPVSLYLDRGMQNLSNHNLAKCIERFFSVTLMDSLNRKHEKGNYEYDDSDGSYSNLKSVRLCYLTSHHDIKIVDAFLKLSDSNLGQKNGKNIPVDTENVKELCSYHHNFPIKSLKLSPIIKEYLVFLDAKKDLYVLRITMVDSYPYTTENPKAFLCSTSVCSFFCWISWHNQFPVLLFSRQEKRNDYNHGYQIGLIMDFKSEINDKISNFRSKNHLETMAYPHANDNNHVPPFLTHWMDNKGRVKKVAIDPYTNTYYAIAHRNLIPAHESNRFYDKGPDKNADEIFKSYPLILPQNDHRSRLLSSTNMDQFLIDNKLEKAMNLVSDKSTLEKFTNATWHRNIGYSKLAVLKMKDVSMLSLFNHSILPYDIIKIDQDDNKTSKNNFKERSTCHQFLRCIKKDSSDNNQDIQNAIESLLPRQTTPNNQDNTNKLVFNQVLSGDLHSFEREFLKPNKNMENKSNITNSSELVIDLIRLYSASNLWEDALRLYKTHENRLPATLTNKDDKENVDILSYDNICDSYLTWLKETKQYAKIGNFCFNENRDYKRAFKYFIKGENFKSAALMLENLEIKDVSQAKIRGEDINLLIKELSIHNLYKSAAELCLKFESFLELNHQQSKTSKNLNQKPIKHSKSLMNNNDTKKIKESALEFYKAGNLYPQALHLAKHYFPGRVTELEECWGDYLVESANDFNGIHKSHFTLKGEKNKEIYGGPTETYEDLEKEFFKHFPDMTRNDLVSPFKKFENLSHNHNKSIKGRDSTDMNCKLAVNHYIEAGATLKAIKTALDFEDWENAQEILNQQIVSDDTKPLFERLAQHYARIKRYDLAISILSRIGNDFQGILDILIQEEAWEELKNFIDKLPSYNTDSSKKDSLEIEPILTKTHVKDQLRFKAFDLISSPLHDKNFPDFPIRADKAERILLAIGDLKAIVDMHDQLGTYQNLLKTLENAFHNFIIENKIEYDFNDLTLKLLKIGDKCEANYEMACQFYMFSTLFRLKFGDIDNKTLLKRSINEGWQKAVRLYEIKGMWNKALDVIKLVQKQYNSTHNSLIDDYNMFETELKRLTLSWATYLGPDSAYHLLTKMNIIEPFFSNFYQPPPKPVDSKDENIIEGDTKESEDNIDDSYSLHEANFELALKMANKCVLSKEKENLIRYNYAEYLKNRKDYAQAQIQYLKAGRIQEIVNMYLELNDFETPLNICTSLLNDPTHSNIVTGRSSFNLDSSFDQNVRMTFKIMIESILQQLEEYALENEIMFAKKAETLYLKARRPDLLLKFFKKANKWDDVMRIARDYLPSQLETLEKELIEINIKEGKGDPQSIFEKAKEMEENLGNLGNIDKTNIADSQYIDKLSKIIDLYTKAGLTACKNEPELSDKSCQHALALSMSYFFNDQNNSDNLKFNRRVSKNIDGLKEDTNFTEERANLLNPYALFENIMLPTLQSIGRFSILGQLLEILLNFKMARNRPYSDSELDKINMVNFQRCSKKDMVEIFIKSEMYQNAKRLADYYWKNNDIQFQKYAENELKNRYMKEGDIKYIKILAKIDSEMAFDIFTSQNKWEECLELVKSIGPESLYFKYSCLYVHHLVKTYHNPNNNNESLNYSTKNILLKIFSLFVNTPLYNYEDQELYEIACGTYVEVAFFITCHTGTLFSSHESYIDSSNQSMSKDYTLAENGLNLELSNYRLWAHIRNAFFLINQKSNFKNLNPKLKATANFQNLNEWIWFSHLTAIKIALQNIFIRDSRLYTIHKNISSISRSSTNVDFPDQFRPNIDFVKGTIAKIDLALLRYSDVLIPAPLAFYLAGTCAKEAGWIDTAFVILNFCLDIFEVFNSYTPPMNLNSLIHEDSSTSTYKEEFQNPTTDQETSTLSFSPLEKYPDIPRHIFHLASSYNYSLPPLFNEEIMLTDIEERVRDWILATSLDRSTNKQTLELPIDSQTGYFVGSLCSRKDANITNKRLSGSVPMGKVIKGKSSTNISSVDEKEEVRPYPPCIITGYPVINENSKIHFKNTTKCANRVDWDNFTDLLKIFYINKVNESREIEDIDNFITKWCGHIMKNNL